MTEIIDDSQTEAALPPEEEWAPKAFDRATFLAIPYERRKEAAKRAAFLLARGVAPTEALRRAQAGMLDDETLRERPVDWEFAAELCDYWRFPHRDPNGHPKTAILDAADHLRGLVEAVSEGHVTSYEAARDQLREFCPNDESLAHALRIYSHYSGARSIREMMAEAAATPAEETEDQQGEELPDFDGPSPDDPEDFIGF